MRVHDLNWRTHLSLRRGVFFLPGRPRRACVRRTIRVCAAHGLFATARVRRLRRAIRRQPSRTRLLVSRSVLEGKHAWRSFGGLGKRRQTRRCRADWNQGETTLGGNSLAVWSEFRGPEVLCAFRPHRACHGGANDFALNRYQPYQLRSDRD